MLQYGIVGGLLFVALRVDFDHRASRLYVIGAALGTLAGLLDEVIQHDLPTRVFTLHDVFVNGGSAALILAFIGLDQPADGGAPLG
ncbi:MAG: VanZ family protein [Sandaracinaceae bacterium]